MERVVKIFTAKGQRIKVDLVDWFLLNAFRWRVSERLGGYLTIRWSYKNKDNAFLFHRFIVKPGPSKVVDHINGDNLDNRRSNLRECTQAENVRNQTKLRSDNTSGYKGVVRRGDGWFARVHYEQKPIESKTYKLKHEAALAYNDLAKKYHGDFACLNKIPDCLIQRMLHVDSEV